MFEQPDILVLLRLITAHLVADFLLQPRDWIENRKKNGIRSPHLYYHIAIVGALTWIFLWDWSHILLPLFILITHFGIDWWKSTRTESIWVFLTDQSAHLLMIVAGWLFYTGIWTETGNWTHDLLDSPSLWIILISYIVVTWPFGYLTAKITSRWQRELAPGSNDLAGLEKAGLWIGCMERFIILTFILLNEYSAIGFLIAAKSVFRFSGKLDDGRERKEAEYILIGTLLSFTLAIVLGIGAVWMLRVFYY